MLVRGLVGPELHPKSSWTWLRILMNCILLMTIPQTLSARINEHMRLHIVYKGTA